MQGAWLHARTVRELQQLRLSERPNFPPSDWDEIDPTLPISLPQFSELQWNATSGGIAVLRPRKSGHNFARPGRDGSLAQYQ